MARQDEARAAGAPAKRRRTPLRLAASAEPARRAAPSGAIFLERFLADDLLWADTLGPAGKTARP